MQTELNYQKRGDKEKSTTDWTESVTRSEFNYLTIPLLAKYTLHDAELGKNLAITFFGGPYGSYLISASANVKSGNETDPIDIDNQSENTDMGAILGGGISYRLNNGGSIIAELRYQMGLKSINKQDPDLRNKGMGITVGYSF
ncbi:MAG: PorT family protein [Bacteroidetes bacterium]|nr:PorT family protein [Bacteroidota bacterium]